MKIKKGKSSIKFQNQKLKLYKRIDNSCFIPDLVQVFPFVENGGNLVLYVATPPTSMTVASCSVILTKMRESNKQTQ